MKLKILLLSVLLTICIMPIFAESELDFKLPKVDFNLTEGIIDTGATKKELLEALGRIDNSNIRGSFQVTDFGIMLKEKMPLLHKSERKAFIKILTEEAEKLGIAKDLNWYFMVEEAFAMPNFTSETVIAEAKTLVESLQNNLLQLDEQSLAQTVKRVKLDMIKMVSQEDNIAIINAFTEAFQNQTRHLGVDRVTFNIFLKDITNDNLILQLISYRNIPNEQVARNVMPALMEHFKLEDFVRENQDNFLKGVLNKGNKRTSLLKFTEMLTRTVADKKLSLAEKELLTKINVLGKIIEISVPMYRDKQMGHVSIAWYKGERSLEKVKAFNLNFGELSPKNASELNRLLEEVPVKDFSKVLPDAKSWMSSLRKWANESIKGNLTTTLVTMVAITVAEELIKNAFNTGYTQNYENIDRITDALADNNMVGLVYNNAYDNKFSVEFDNYIKENDLEEQEKTNFINTQLLFEEALYANFIEESDNLVSEEIWQCFALNENCANKKA